MRYRLGNMDIYSVAVMETCMENAAFFKATLTENINADKLSDSLKKAIKYFPLFGCRLIYDKEYLLEDNDADVGKTIKHCKTEDRPVIFGNNETTDGYLFQICYFENELSFEWCHAVSDGRGALAFFSKFLDAYYDLNSGEIPTDFPLQLSFESVYDKNVKSFGQVKQEAGFNYRRMPVIKNGYKCLNHVLKLHTSDLLAFGKRADATPASILVPLMCKAIRTYLPDEDNNVSCGICIDGRKALGLETMHGCVFNKVITYTDRMNKFDLMKQATLYRSILDVFCQRENLIAYAVDMIDSTDALYRLKPRFLKRDVMKIATGVIKNRMNNIGITYIGRVPFSDNVKEHMKDFLFCSWPDIGNCVMAVNDLDGILTIVVSENYRDKRFINTFIELCRQNNINIELTDEYTFEQANVRL